MNTETVKKNFMSGKHWVIIIIILVAGYSFIKGSIDLTKDKPSENEWTTEDYEVLVNRCITDSGKSGVLYPELTKTYCECSLKEVMAKYSKSEYLEIIKKDSAEQMKIFLPYFQDCLVEYKNAIDQAKE